MYFVSHRPLKNQCWNRHTLVSRVQLMPLIDCINDVLIINLDHGLYFLQGRGETKEVYNGIQRQFKLTKLNASTGYTVRLAAINSVGKRY